MIEYGTNQSMAWHSSFGEVRFRVSLDGKPIICRVTQECIQDHLGNPIGEDECLTVAKEHFDEVTDQIGHYITVGRFEPDGSILLRTGDWR